jgi:hypothetical protein
MGKRLGFALVLVACVGGCCCPPVGSSGGGKSSGQDSSSVTFAFFGGLRAFFTPESGTTEEARPQGEVQKQSDDAHAASLTIR